MNEAVRMLWAKETLERHPVIAVYPQEQWQAVARFNGWLPFWMPGSERRNKNVYIIGGSVDPVA